MVLLSACSIGRKTPVGMVGWLQTTSWEVCGGIGRALRWDRQRSPQPPEPYSASGHTRMVVTDPRQSQLEKTRTKIIRKTEKIPAQNRNNVSLQPKEGESHQERKTPCGGDSPREQAQLTPEEGCLPVSSKSGTVEPVPRTGTQPGQTFPDSSCQSASDE